jgi:hypothetical protein
LTFSISGQHPVAGHIVEELRSIRRPLDDPSSAQLQFHFDAPVSAPKEGILYTPFSLGRDYLYADLPWCRYRLDAQESRILGRVELKAPAGKKRYLPSEVVRFLDWNYLKHDEILAKNFMYDLFDFSTQLQQLDLGQSYLHASAFERHGKAVAIMAWGGIGKTTTLLKIVLEMDWNFLSDDLGLVNSHGEIYRSPKKMQIYAYNLKNQLHLQDRLMRNRPLADRLSWYLSLLRRGPKGVRRRVSAEELFGADRVASKANLSQAFFIERHKKDGFEERELSAEEAANRCAWVLQEELAPYGLISHCVHSAGLSEHFVLPTNIHFDRTRQVLRNAFSGCRLHHILIPVQAGPDALVSYLSKRF